MSPSLALIATVCSSVVIHVLEHTKHRTSHFMLTTCLDILKDFDISVPFSLYHLCCHTSQVTCNLLDE